MISISSPTDMDGRADFTSVATAAALGAAALVPKKGLKPGADVLTPSAPARLGFWRTCGLANRTPVRSNRRNAGPRELNDSGSSSSARKCGTAATVSAPFAEAASGSIVWEAVPCSAIVNVPKSPRAM